MLQMGKSKPWGEAMLTMTRGTSGETTTVNAKALLDYFKPLQVKTGACKLNFNNKN